MKNLQLSRLDQGCQSHLRLELDHRGSSWAGLVGQAVMALGPHTDGSVGSGLSCNASLGASGS